MLVLSDLEAWRDYLQGQVNVAAALVAAEVARPVDSAPQEQFLHDGYIGHLRNRVIALTAELRLLQEAVATVAASGTHRVQYLTPPVNDGMKTTPAKPPRWTSG